MKQETPTQNIEQEKEPGRLHFFFEMSQQEERALKDRVAEHDGLVRIFVHPDFERYSGFEAAERHYPGASKELQKAEKVFQRILASESEKLPPLFVFESGADKGDFEQKEERIANMAQGDIYVIRTEMSNPTPLSPDDYETYRWAGGFDPETSVGEQMWEWTRYELKRLGAKRVLIGGVELYFAKQDGKTIHGGCLGHTIEQLKDEFDLELSALTWPAKRGDEPEEIE